MQWTEKGQRKDERWPVQVSDGAGLSVAPNPDYSGLHRKITQTSSSLLKTFQLKLE